MSDGKIFENKQQLIHIASEVAVLLGITFYFSSQNKKLSKEVEELTQRLDEQEEQIQRIDNGLRQLAGAMTMANQRMETAFGVPPRTIGQSNPLVPNPLVPSPLVPSPSKPSKTIKFKTPLAEKKVMEPVEEEDEEEELTDSDLDDEIRAEIQELTDQDTSLKKQN